jgi:hypothetical protein
LSTSLKEEDDFVILPDVAWQYLYRLYGGNDIPRLSIEIEKDGEAGSHEYMIEVYL